MGEEPEYDEDGNVKPVEFSTANLCAFLQAGHAPDEVEYISTVEEVKSVTAMGKNFWSFNVIYRSEEDESVEIPTFVLKSSEIELFLLSSRTSTITCFHINRVVLLS